MAIDEDREALRKISTTSSNGPNFHAPLWGSCRLSLAFVCLFATFCFFTMRLNLSFAMVCMIKPTTVNQSITWANTSQTVDDDQDVADVIGESEVAACGLSSTPQRFQPGYGGDMDWDKEVQGAMLSGFYYGFCITQLLGGWITDRIGGSKTIILSSMLIMSLLTILSPVLAQWNAKAFFAGRVVLGLAAGLSLPSIQPLFARWSSPNERGTLLGLAFAGFNLGSCLTFPLAGLLCQYGFAGGWPSVFYTTGLFGLVWCAAAYFVVYDSPETHPRISADELTYLEPYSFKSNTGKKYVSIPWKKILTSVPINVLHVCSFCQSWGFYTLVIGLPTFMKEGLNFDLSQNGLLSAMPYLASLFAHLIVGKAFDWFRAKQLCTLTILRKIFNTVGFLIPALTLFLVGQLDCNWRYIAVVLLVISQAGAEIGIMGGYVLSNIDLAPQYSGVVQGISMTIGTIPGFVSPMVIAYLTPKGSPDEWVNVFYIASGMYVAGVLIYLVFGSSERLPWTVDENYAKVKENLCEKPAALLGRQQESSDNNV